MSEHGSVEAPRSRLLFEVSLLLIVEGLGTYLAFGLGLRLGDAIGQSATVRWAGAIALLSCFGVVKTWLNLWLLRREYRGELGLPLEVQFDNLVLPRRTLDAAVSGTSGDPDQDDSAPRSADPQLLAGVGLGLPLFVVTTLSVSGNPYLVFLIPVVAYGALHGVGRSGAVTVRPRPYHVGLALTLTYSVLPFGLALVIVLWMGILPALPDVFPYSVAYHFWYSPMHVVLLPLAMVPVVYASNYCLLLAYDIRRAGKGILPDITSEDAEATTDEPSPATTDESPRTGADETAGAGDVSQLLWVFTPAVPFNAVILAWAYGFRPVTAVGVATVALSILGIAMYVDDESIALGDPGSLVAGAAGGLVASAIAYAVPLFYTPAAPYRYVVWLPVAALVGFVTGVLLYAAVESRDRATARSG